VYEREAVLLPSVRESVSATLKVVGVGYVIVALPVPDQTAAP
jgi:hypothetical protein